MADGAPPRLGSDTLRTRAANSAKIFEARQRTRQAVAEEFETVDDPARVGIGRRGGRFRPREDFLDRQRPREAAFQLNDQFPRQELGPQDVREADDGFRPTEGVRRRSAAFEFEDQTPLDEVDPQRDIVPQGNAFGLAEPRQRDIAAAELDPEFPRQDLGHDDITAADDGFRPAEDVQRRAAAFEFEDETPLQDVDPFGDVTQRDDGFGLAEPRQRDIAAARLDDEFPNQDLGRDDITAADDGFAPTGEVQRRAAASDLDPQFPEVDIGADDVTQQGDAFGLTRDAQREIGAARLDERTDADVTADDVEFQDDQLVFERRVF